MDETLPRVVLISTTSVDGRISLGRHERLLDPSVGERWATIAVPDAFGDRPGHDPVVVLEGSGSFVDADAPAPAWPEPDDPGALFADHVPRRAPHWFVVADGRGRVDWQFTGDDRTALHLLVSRSTPAGYLARLRELGVGWFVVGDERVDLRLALQRIRQVFGAELVVVDAGGTLNASLLRAGLVDELDLVTLPGLVGVRDAPTMMDGPPLGPDELPVRLELLDVATDRGAVRTRYLILR